MFATTQTDLRSMTVVGFFPSGEGFSDTISVKTPFEAKIRAIAAHRYAEDGGDLDIVCVLDAVSGKVIDEQHCTADLDLMEEADAVETVLTEARALLLEEQSSSVLAVSEGGLLAAQVEFLEYVLQEASEIFSSIVPGSNNVSGEDMTVEFTSVSGVIHDLVPSEALLAVVSSVLAKTESVAAFQVREMVLAAGHAIDLACLDALCDY